MKSQCSEAQSSEPSYQMLTNALYTFLTELDFFKSELKKKRTGRVDNFGESFWNPGKTKKSQTLTFRWTRFFQISLKRFILDKCVEIEIQGA